MRHRHLRDARRRLDRAAETTTVQDIDDHLDAINQALDDIDAWADEPGRRLARLRGQLEAMEDRIEPSLQDELH